MWNWRDELKLSWYTILAQVTGSSYYYKKKKGLTDLKIHIARERAKVTRAFKFKIMYRDNWRCYLDNQRIPYGEGELEHDIPLVRGGYTDEKNCHASHKRCNRAKGMLTAQEYLKR